MSFNGSSPIPYENIENDDFIYHSAFNIVTNQTDYDQPETQIQESDVVNSWQQPNLIEPCENIENNDQFYHFQCFDQQGDQIQEQSLYNSQQQRNPIEECQSALKKSEIKKKIKKQNKKLSKNPSKKIIEPFDKFIPFEEDFNRIIGKQIFELDLNQENDLSEKFKSLEDVQKLFPKFSEFRKQLVEYLKEIYQTDQKCYIKFILLVVKYSIYNFLITLKILDDYGIQRRYNIRRQLNMLIFHEALIFVLYDLRKFSNWMHVSKDIQDFNQSNTFNSREQAQIPLEWINIQYSLKFNNLKWENIIKQLKVYFQIGKNYYKSHNCDYYDYIFSDNNKLNDPKNDLDWFNEKHGQSQSKAGKKKFQIMLKERLDKNNIRDFTLNHHFTFVLKEFKAQKSLYIEDIFNLIIEYGL